MYLDINEAIIQSLALDIASYNKNLQQVTSASSKAITEASSDFTVAAARLQGLVEMYTVLSYSGYRWEYAF